MMDDASDSVRSAWPNAEGVIVIGVIVSFFSAIGGVIIGLVGENGSSAMIGNFLAAIGSLGGCCLCLYGLMFSGIAYHCNETEVAVTCKGRVKKKIPWSDMAGVKYKYNTIHVYSSSGECITISNLSKRDLVKMRDCVKMAESKRG